MEERYAGYEIDLNAKCVCGCMEGNRIHKIYRFPNNYGASVVSGPKQREAGQGAFRMYVLRFDSPAPENCWEIAQDTEITDDTVECSDWTEVLGYLDRVLALPAWKGNLIQLR
ncbi:MAG TPA: hypothetical protein VLH13_00765 [Methanomassiliicoccales archaeon]|nr:hypothetical protein [Methanomassiliicoccales archaeon]